MKTREYIEEVTIVLYNFQLLEEFLRNYISSAIKKVRESTKGMIPFKYNSMWVDRDSFGTLIDKFERTNDNQSLIRQLKKIRPRRNKVAHKAMLLTAPQWKDDFQMELRIADLKELRRKTKAIINRVATEYSRLEDINTQN